MKLFPSPVGELHFSMKKYNLAVIMKRVSVPCRGTTFLNSYYDYQRAKADIGFRPLSGNYISQYIAPSSSILISPAFPSPVGELHFSIKCLVFRFCIFRFRPLSGNYISQFQLNLSGKLSGLYCFRPLSGNYISQYVRENDRARWWQVSVPCRGTTFLNTIPTIPPPVWAHGRDCVGKIFLEK